MTVDRVRATQQAYDHVAADFAARTAERSTMAAEFFDRFVASLSPGSLVADLGCGPGHDVRRIIEVGHRPVALDRSRGLLDQCPPKAMRLAGDLTALPLGDSTVDAVWSSAALLHIDRTQIAATFSEWTRALRPIGVVAFATSLGDDEGWELVPAGQSRRPELSPGQRRWFVHHDEATLRREIEHQGWTILWSAVRHSHRDWLQVLATTSDEK